MAGSNAQAVMVIGTRPEAIKMAPLAIQLRDSMPKGDFRLVITSQHGRILTEVLDSFGLDYEFDLALMSPQQPISQMLSRVILGVGESLRELKPKLVLVHGDTTTALGAGLAAFCEGIPVAHIEAGLRTRNLGSPFPEELNRQAIARLSSLHFAPTHSAASSLLEEAIDQDSIYVTGNTVIDSLRMTVEALSAGNHPRVMEAVKLRTGFDVQTEDFILVTAHRRENLESGLASIFAGVKRLAQEYRSIRFLLPLHPNPRIHDEATRVLADCPNVSLLGPVDYFEFAYLMSLCLMILTDSGGIQEEAPFLGKPVLVLRETTERPEGIEAGTAELVGTNPDRIFAVCSRLISDREEYLKFARATNPYGDGYACDRIVPVILEFLDERQSQ